MSVPYPSIVTSPNPILDILISLLDPVAEGRFIVTATALSTTIKVSVVLTVYGNVVGITIPPVIEAFPI